MKKQYTDTDQRRILQPAREMKLRPYHNPENVDESRVPDGWRFLYADEAGQSQNKPCRIWLPKNCYPPMCFDPESTRWTGQKMEFTYIVPVA